MSVDPLMAACIRDADPEDRPALAMVAGEADTLSRHLPAYLAPAAIRVAWLTDRAWKADQTDSPHRVALWRMALAASDELAQHMEPLVLRAPDDPSGLT